MESIIVSTTFEGPKSLHELHTQGTYYLKGAEGQMEGRYVNSMSPRFSSKRLGTIK